MCLYQGGNSRRFFRSVRPLNVQRAKPSGFTLIELLVVISIIALLVAILLPALTQARLAAQGALCLSRLRQFGITIQTYRADWNEYYPVSMLSDLSMDWLTQMGPYFDPGQSNYTNDLCKKWHRNNDASVNMFLCPTAGHTPSHNAAHLIYPNAHIHNWRVHNYRISAQFGFDKTTASLTGGGPRRIFHGNLSRVPMVGESKGSNMHWGRLNTAFYWAPATHAGLFRHSGETSNYLFLDSHAANVGTSDAVVQKIIANEIIFKPRYE